MAFTVYQTGNALRAINENGAIATLTLPTGVTLDSNVVPRFAVFNEYVIMVNSPSKPLTIDANLKVRLLTPTAPASAMVAAASSGSGALSGDYKAKQTFRVLSPTGKLISESNFGPVSNTVTLASKKLNLTNINLSADEISAIGLYRTTAGTSTFFHWLDLEGNTQTSIEDDLSDAGLSTFAAPSLGTAPDMFLIAEFRNRLFGVSKSAKDDLRYTEIGAMYAWPGDNVQPTARLGADSRGVTALVRRRDSLGIGKSNGLYQLSGTDDTNFRIVNVSENCGIEATDSVAVYKDVVFFLWKDGVYTWDTGGIKCISDGKVRKWFTTDSTLNTSKFQKAFAHIDPFKFKYRLFLASADSDVVNCWIEYDFMEDKWWGPHTSYAFNPSAAFLQADDSGLFIPIIGGRDGWIRRERIKRRDDVDTPVDFDVVTDRVDAGEPIKEKYFGELSVTMKPQFRGTLDVQAAVGDLDAIRVTTNADHADMTFPSRRLSRLGLGKTFKLRFRNNEPGVNVNLNAYEVDPVIVVGRR